MKTNQLAVSKFTGSTISNFLFISPSTCYVVREKVNLFIVCSNGKKKMHTGISYTVMRLVTSDRIYDGGPIIL
jgi:hypothetical protein